MKVKQFIKQFQKINNKFGHAVELDLLQEVLQEVSPR